MQIPKRFKLAGRTIDVRMDNKLLHDDGSIGRAEYSNNIIILQNSGKQNKIKRSNLEQCFLHELTHWIFYSMSEHDLQKNEKIVDLFATFLHQALESMEYK